MLTDTSNRYLRCTSKLSPPNQSAPGRFEERKKDKFVFQPLKLRNRDPVFQAAWKPGRHFDSFKPFHSTTKKSDWSNNLENE